MAEQPSEKATFNVLLALPPELFTLLTAYLPFSDLLALRSVSRRLRALAFPHFSDQIDRKPYYFTSTCEGCIFSNTAAVREPEYRAEHVITVRDWSSRDDNRVVKELLLDLAGGRGEAANDEESAKEEKEESNPDVVRAQFAPALGVVLCWFAPLTYQQAQVVRANAAVGSCTLAHHHFKPNVPNMHPRPVSPDVRT